MNKRIEDYSSVYLKQLRDKYISWAEMALQKGKEILADTTMKMVYSIEAELERRNAA